MSKPYLHLEFAPQAPQAPINHAVGVTSFSMDASEPIELAAQWAPLGRVMKRKPEDELTPESTVNGRWKQTQINQRRKKITETVTLKSRPGIGALHPVFSGIARDPAVSTPDRERSPQMSVCNRGLLPVALPYPEDSENLVPGTLAYFYQDPKDKCHTTLIGNKGIPTAQADSPLHSKTKDVVGTVLSCGKRQHAVVHLHPLSNRSLKRFTTMITNGSHMTEGTVSGRIRTALTTGPNPVADHHRILAVSSGYGSVANEAATLDGLPADGYKHMLRINIGTAIGGHAWLELDKTGDSVAPAKPAANAEAKDFKASWTKRSAFASTELPSGGAPAPVTKKADVPSKAKSGTTSKRPRSKPKK